MTENFINIIVADDDLDDHEFFREAIADMKIVGYNLTQVYNGVEALNFLLKKGRFLNTTHPLPDVIVLDLNMPILDGFAVLADIRKQKELDKIPVYVLTTSRSEAHQKKCMELGCSGYFVKPGNLKELRSHITKMLANFSGK